jgi:hypothetical protein
MYNWVVEAGGGEVPLLVVASITGNSSILGLLLLESGHANDMNVQSGMARVLTAYSKTIGNFFFQLHQIRHNTSVHEEWSISMFVALDGYCSQIGL